MGFELRAIGNSPSASVDLYVEATKVATFKEDGNVELPGKGNLVTDSQVFGVGQTPQDVTASRILGATYTNNTGKPIIASITFTATSANAYARISVDGRAISISVVPSGFGAGVQAVVPNGSKFTYNLANSTLGSIVEYR